MQKKKRATLIATVLFLLLSACQSPAENTVGGDSGTERASTAQSGQRDTVDTPIAASIELSDGDIRIEGTGASENEGIVSITSPGAYVISGALSDGQILVEAGKDDTVELILNGITIASSTSSPIYCKQADELVITLAEGSGNTVTDPSSYIYADQEAEEPDAAIFSKTDLTLRGDGSLTVQGNFNNGIGTKDELVIEGGTYHITAKNHGIRGRDSVTVLDGVLEIYSGNDGIQANNSNEGKGWITLEGGSYTIVSDHDGIQAESALTIQDGDFSILAGGGAGAEDVDAEESCKGLKAGDSITITGGVFALDCADDTIHSNGDILISGGGFVLASGDDGIHADGDLTITDGVIDITTSYEGLEAMTMTLAGGEISLFATDDGINVAGGDGSSGIGRFGQDSFSDTSGRWLKITGGTITVNAQGDGIDVNGNAEMTGGEVYVHGPTSNGDGALDYDGAFLISGGTLVAAGSSGMAEAPSSSSAQPSLRLYYSSTQEAGATITLRDSTGAVLIQFTPEKPYQSVVISAPGLVDGDVYTVYADDQAVVEVTLSGGVTSIFDTGEAVSGGMGRPGGGMRGEGGPGNTGGRPGEGQPGAGPGSDRGDTPPPAREGR